MGHSSIKNWIVHDPFYRRVKDGLLMILALFGASGMAGYDLPTLIRKFTGTTEVTTKSEGRSESRAIRAEERAISFKERLSGLETALESVDKKVDKLEGTVDKRVDKLESKIDRLLEMRWNTGR